MTKIAFYGWIDGGRIEGASGAGRDSIGLAVVRRTGSLSQWKFTGISFPAPEKVA